MSFFGKNIRKIRSINSFSQQDLGDLFGIKRATLGAYEEGRSEPKLDTIIKVANHFSIPIDDLVTKELTVNQLLNFKSKLTIEVDDIAKERFPKIPCITEKMSSEYIHHYHLPTFIDDLPFLSLPLNEEKEFRGFEISNLVMTNGDQGFYPRDIVIGELTPKSVYKKLNNGTLVFLVTESEIIFRRLYYTKDVFILRADHKAAPDIELSIKEINELWRVRYVFYRRLPEFSENLDQKLDSLEQQIQQLKEKL